MKTHIETKAVEVIIENAIKVQETMASIPTSTITTTYVKNDKIICETDADFELEDEEIKDVIEYNLLEDEDVIAYETKCHKCDHDEPNRRKAKGCYDLKIISSKGEILIDNPIN